MAEVVHHGKDGKDDEDETKRTLATQSGPNGGEM